MPTGRELRHQTPWVRKPPSEYVWEHARFASQPLEEPEHPSQLLELFKWNRADQTLVFSSDYPHWDFDSPAQAFPRLPDDLRRRIFYDSAREPYGFPAPAASPGVSRSTARSPA